METLGKNVQEYKGPCEADGIVDYLKKQSGLASIEIKFANEATVFVGENKVAIFDNFSALAEKLCSDYDFGHTLNAKLLPRGESSVSRPVVRLFKPFNELFVDFQISFNGAFFKSLRDPFWKDYFANGAIGRRIHLGSISGLSFRLNANHMVVGTLCGFDQFMNLVVDNPVEVNGNEKNDIGMVLTAVFMAFLIDEDSNGAIDQEELKKCFSIHDKNVAVIHDVQDGYGQM
ncbi:hypothetical protein JHK86_055856 [Glycine max]|nr:hypothetical protein JHK86_055856 [Glycine max]